ncbi:MAG: hypothetical protein ABJP48_02255 [Erythrobacter sp.]
MIQDGELTFSDVVQGTLSVVMRNVQPFALYLALMTLIGAGLEWGAPALLGQSDIASSDFEAFFEFVGLGAGLVEIVVFIILVIAQYALWQSVMHNEQLGNNYADARYLAFAGQSILAVIGTGFAMLLLIIPGIILASRWSLAPALLIGNNEGAIDALGKSWDAVRGNTVPVALAYTAGAVGLSLVSYLFYPAAGFQGSSSVMSLVITIASHLVSNVGTVLLVAIGVYLFSVFFSSNDAITEVFE